MIESFTFLKFIIDSVPAHIAVINSNGDIVFTNRTWDIFGSENNCTITDDWIGINYLDVCRKAGQAGDEYGKHALKIINEAIIGRTSLYFEYPCHSKVEKRWFLMSTTSFEYENNRYIIISHRNITERKPAEEYAKRPVDICARDGGEKFVFVFGNTVMDDIMAVIFFIVSVNTFNINN
jgi:hypothetical protein